MCGSSNDFFYYLGVLVTQRFGKRFVGHPPTMPNENTEHQDWLFWMGNQVGFETMESIGECNGYNLEAVKQDLDMGNDNFPIVRTKDVDGYS